MDFSIIRAAFFTYRRNFGKITLAGLITFGIKTVLFYGFFFLWLYFTIPHPSFLYYLLIFHPWISYIAIFILFAFIQLFAYGFNRILLHIQQGQKVSIGSLFYYFHHQFGKAFLLSFLTTAFRAAVLAGCLALYLNTDTSYSDMTNGEILLRLFIIAIVLFYFWMETSLFLSPYLLSEDKSLHVWKLLKNSFCQMHGKRSFLVGIFFCFVPFEFILGVIYYSAGLMANSFPVFIIPIIIFFFLLFSCFTSFLFTVNAQLAADIFADTSSPGASGFPKEDSAPEMDGLETDQAAGSSAGERNPPSAEIATMNECRSDEEN